MERGLICALGGLFGGFVPATTGVVAWWLGFESIAGLALIGIVPGAIAGSTLAPWTVASPSALPPSLAAAALGVVLGIVVVVVGGVLDGTAAQFLFLLPIVLAYGLILGFPVAGPTAYGAALLLRIAVRRQRWAAASVVSLVAVTLLLGIPALALGGQISARRELPNLQAAPPFVALLPVRLDWEIANCSPWGYSFRVVEAHLDGTARRTVSPRRRGVPRAVSGRWSPDGKPPSKQTPLRRFSRVARAASGGRGRVGDDVVDTSRDWAEWRVVSANAVQPGLTGVALCSLGQTS